MQWPCAAKVSYLSPRIAPFRTGVNGITWVKVGVNHRAVTVSLTGDFIGISRSKSAIASNLGANPGLAFRTRACLDLRG